MPVNTLLPKCERRRAERQRVAYRVLSEDCTEEAVEYLSRRFGEAADVLEHWGDPDTSVLPLASSTRQLVTPGLYGRPPVVTLPSGAAAASLAGPSGLMDQCGYWARSQHVQYLAFGIGICFRRQGIRRVGERLILTDRIVPPHRVIVETHPDDGSIVEIRELGMRGETAVWDCWSIVNPEAPTRQLREAKKDGEIGRVIESIPWSYWTPEGEPYLPWTAPRVVDTGEFWPCWRLSMLHGTFEVVGNATQTSYVARFATGNHLIAVGVNPDSVGGVATSPRNMAPIDQNQPNTGTPAQIVRIMPGMMRFMQPATAGTTVQFQEVGPGANLVDLSNYKNQSVMELHTADGLQPTDATRQSANPTSGAALEISARSKRELAQQVEPWFRMADLDAIRHYAWLLTGEGEDTPAEGYGITYQTIPLTPTEQADLREDLDWELSHGQISEVDVYCRRHPGATRETAFAELARVREDQAKIKSQGGNNADQLPEVPGADRSGDASGVRRAGEQAGQGEQGDGGAAPDPGV